MSAVPRPLVIALLGIFALAMLGCIVLSGVLLVAAVNAPDPRAYSTVTTMPGAVKPQQGTRFAKGCPEGYPVKASTDTNLYHIQGSLYYDQVEPEVCFTVAFYAEQAGFRPARR